jgi:hypothetical protein
MVHHLHKRLSQIPTFGGDLGIVSSYSWYQNYLLALRLVLLAMCFVPVFRHIAMDMSSKQSLVHNQAFSELVTSSKP